LAIRFFSDYVNYKFRGKGDIAACIVFILADHKRKIGAINIIFTNDSNLLKINRKYLGRNNYTDIITFNYSEKDNISADLYISVERVRDNAVIFKVEEKEELNRVIIHGILHLVGFKDKQNKEKKEMKKMEDFYLRNIYKKGSENL